MPKVVRINRSERQPNTMYIGRPTIWGNPFVIGRDGNREQVIAKYKEYIESKPELKEKARIFLKGKDLACFCAPLACHGDVLLTIANEGES